MEGLSSIPIVVDSILRSAVEAFLAEAAVLAVKTLACSLLLMKYLPSGAVFPEVEDAFGSFPIFQLHTVNKPGPENVDGSETEDDEDEDEEEADDQDDDGGEEEDGSEEDGEDEGDPEDKPAANGEGGSGDEEEDDDDADDDDDDGDDEEDEEDEDEDEEEEELPQPPAKKRK